MTWQPIDTAPKDGSKIVCWANGWDDPCFLVWKTNYRIVESRKHDPASVNDMADSYFGDMCDLTYPNGLFTATL